MKKVPYMVKVDLFCIFSIYSESEWALTCAGLLIGSYCTIHRYTELLEKINTGNWNNPLWQFIAEVRRSSNGKFEIIFYITSYLHDILTLKDSPFLLEKEMKLDNWIQVIKTKLTRILIFSNVAGTISSPI